MNRAAVFVLLLWAASTRGEAALNAAQMKAAERVPAITVPSPAEFFAGIDKTGKPDWVSFYRPPVPTAYPTRPQTALNLGALVTDGFVAVEAQDGQQVKNTGKDIITLARALGVGEDVLSRGKSISDFADKNNWTALREELEATTNEVRRAMMSQRDEDLSMLITAGAWLRALQVGSRAVELSGSEPAASLLRQQELVAYLRSSLVASPEKTQSTAVLVQVKSALDAVGQSMTVPSGEPFPLERVVAIKETTGQLIAEISSKQP